MSNKRRRVGKPWWNENLPVAWNKVCLKESLWVKCKEPNLKQIYKVGYVQTREEFDRQVQKAKRLNWFKFQIDLFQNLGNDTEEFLKKNGKTGVSNCQSKSILREVVSELMMRL